MKFTIKNHRLAPIGSQLPFVASPNVGGALAPKFIAIHYTASGPDADIARYFSQKSANVAAHLVVPRDGSICQCVPFDKVAWHAGQSRWTGKGGRQYSGLNNSAIGIEIENWGPLKKSGAGWVSWTGAPVEGQKVIEARHKFGAPDCGWEVFTTAQLETVIAAVQAICAEYAIEDILGHDDIAPGRKSDPGPAWDMATFKAKVKGEAEDGDAVMVVHCPSGLNIRSGAGASFPLVHNMLPDGTKVLVHEASGKWRYVSVLEASGKPDFSGWVHGDWLV
ncbi:N-acetylmuramoyl-L-alanine amidase [Phyllobacterium sp. BT25]|uniref:N-acetylmuramoyl-L-alanine amidase n=1 Tax=Phyllobacterium pellucidum TaxID=2740464 RepID=A0A849VPH3_9HYPH|nr:N-acetylmuramoyl-L-alanine amidase [Phyllobacterium pellucidum]NTS31751.1 N-acetylmuramoyl-L-alanine amidase [Phyllobacterium pellucidum]